jgi:hypothetical protein
VWFAAADLLCCSGFIAEGGLKALSFRSCISSSF